MSKETAKAALEKLRSDYPAGIPLQVLAQTPELSRARIRKIMAEQSRASNAKRIVEKSLQAFERDEDLRELRWQRRDTSKLQRLEKEHNDRILALTLRYDGAREKLKLRAERRAARRAERRRKFTLALADESE